MEISLFTEEKGNIFTKGQLNKIDSIKYNRILQQMWILKFQGAENLWFCMTCGEFLKDHPAKIQSLCFGHMCEDLHPPKISERMDKVMAMLAQAKFRLQEKSAELKSKSIWGWLKKSICSNISPIQSTGLLFGFLITMLIAVNINQTFSSLYDSEQWQLLQTCGDMIKFQYN